MLNPHGQTNLLKRETVKNKEPVSEKKQDVGEVCAVPLWCYTRVLRRSSPLSAAPRREDTVSRPEPLLM